MHGFTVAATALLASLVNAVPADDLQERAAYGCSKDALASTLSSSKYKSAASAWCSDYIRPKYTSKATSVVSVTSTVKVTPPAVTQTVTSTVLVSKSIPTSKSVTNTVTATKTNVISSTVMNTVTITNTATSVLTSLVTETDYSVVKTVTSAYGNKVDNTHYFKRYAPAVSTNSAGYPTFIAASYKPSVISSSCSCLINAQGLATSTIKTTVVSTATVKKTITASGGSTIKKTVTTTSTKNVGGAVVTKTIIASVTQLTTSTATRTIAATITNMLTSTVSVTNTYTTVLPTTSVSVEPHDVYCNVAGLTNGHNLITDGWDIASTAADCMGLCHGADGCAMMHFGCPNSDGCYCGLYSSDDLDASYYMGSSTWGSAYNIWDALCDSSSYS